MLRLCCDILCEFVLGIYQFKCLSIDFDGRAGHLMQNTSFIEQMARSDWSAVHVLGGWDNVQSEYQPGQFIHLS